MGTATLEAIHNDLKFIKSEISEIKERMVNVDTILTEDDIESLHEAEKDLREGKTKRLK